jgi:hypothetical protein
VGRVDILVSFLILEEMVSGVNKVILNWQRPLREGDEEVAKRSSREEPM